MSEGLDDVLRQAQARVGRTLKDKWTLDRLLGVGGMASVYAATHRNRKRVAVKVLHPTLSMNSSIRQRFLREGYAANSVAHPGAVAVDDDDVTEDGCAFLVMELLEGETLEARWERKGKRLPADEVLSLADQILDTLAAAHDNGIVHRDLKPENLFLTHGGIVKVLDFGIARLRELGQSATKTQTGSTMGTPAFMPPEQARGRWEDVDGRSDLWAVGATMFTLLTGRYVHEAGTVNEALVLAVTQKARSVAVLEPDLPFPVTELVDRALAYDKNDRWPSATTMQTALRRAYAGTQSANEPADAALARPITLDSFDEDTRVAPERSGDAPPAAVVDSNIPRDSAPARKPGAVTTARGVAHGVVALGLAARKGKTYVLGGGIVLLGAAIGVWAAVGRDHRIDEPPVAAALVTAEVPLDSASTTDRAPREPDAVRLDDLPVDRPAVRPAPRATAMPIDLDSLDRAAKAPMASSSAAAPKPVHLVPKPIPIVEPTEDPFARRR